MFSVRAKLTCLEILQKRLGVIHILKHGICYTQVIFKKSVFVFFFLIIRIKLKTTIRGKKIFVQNGLQVYIGILYYFF